MNKSTDSLIDRINWNSQGLIPAIAQDAETKKVLMLAWMNADALAASLDRGEAIYWSRSRQRLWHKGESSGHTQQIIDMRLDCDADTLLLLVEQKGGIACHTGRESCLYQQFSNEQNQWLAVEPIIKDPKDIYTTK
ncbi:MAG: phosphoribosyl-AMP cyclohydrolase [Cellvibrionales bacterium]|jgi:phosphoribosyl-AMP cyclohydrolase|nr:phosphoribosyl-AMP cyclohydrolase [Cellvibrionales bacterium]HCH19858.1 phosphoribosyl-AMP cyclohydrolase [Cellvibrionales bacterium]